jgi:hypothetical protein
MYHPVLKVMQHTSCEMVTIFNQNKQKHITNDYLQSHLDS